VGDLSGRSPTPVIANNEVIDSTGRRFAGMAQRGFHPHGLNDRGQIAFSGRVFEGSNSLNAVLRADPKPGVSPGNPLLPGAGDVLPGGGWRFPTCTWAYTGSSLKLPCFIDPPVAVGYTYSISAGAARFETVMIPAPLPNGDREFAVEYEGNVVPLRAGERFDFTQTVPGGVATFQITGISTAEALDPADSRAFVGGLTFVGTYSATDRVTMVPIVEQTTGILELKQAVVAGCKSVVGTVTLANPAPVGGTVVEISDTLASAITPIKVTVPEGASTKTFSIKTTPVSLAESGNVIASLNGVTNTRPLTVRPMGLLSLALSPSTVVGSQPVVGTAKLECKAGPGPVEVTLLSANPTAAVPVAASIFVPQGLQSATFDVTTSSVPAKTTATISGTANDVTKSKKLTVNVAAAASPTSLKFGSVAVGATSATQVVTLSNKGALALSVTGINLTGTNASWFAQTNNCPASLAAGQTCTISVTFKPLAASSKSAKLSIATSATSTPLSVSVSGTGI